MGGVGKEPSRHDSSWDQWVALLSMQPYVNPKGPRGRVLDFRKGP